MNIHVDAEKCTGCQLCVKACPYGAIEMDERLATITEACTLCGGCVSVCPVDAIIWEAPAVADVDTSEYQGVWVIGEVGEDELAGVTWELLGKGRELAEDLDTQLSLVVLGDKASELAQKTAQSGPDRVFAVEDAALAQYRTGTYTDVISGLINKHKPEIVLFGATEQGRDLAPRIATRIKTGLTADCTGLETRRAAAGADETGLRRQYYGAHHHPQPPPADGHGSSAGYAAAGITAGTYCGNH